MKNKNLTIYRVVTALFSLMLLAGAITYFTNYEMASEMFTSLGVPTSIIYPLAIAKIIGIAAIWLVKNTIIKQLAYLGFALDYGRVCAFKCRRWWCIWTCYATGYANYIVYIFQKDRVKQSIVVVHFIEFVKYLTDSCQRVVNPIKGLHVSLNHVL